jgi:hypothetical protein
MLDQAREFLATATGQAAVLVLAACVALILLRLLLERLFPIPYYNPSAITALVIGIAALEAWAVPVIGLTVASTGAVIGARSRGGLNRWLAATGAVLSLLGLAAAVLNWVFGFYRLPVDTLFKWDLPAWAQSAASGAATPTAEPERIACLRWDQVTAEMFDQVVCAHGTLTQVTSSEVTATRFEFSDEPNTFFAYSVDETFVRPETGKPWQPGDCVMLYGTVGVYSRIPYVDLKERPPEACAPGLR